MEWAGIVRVDIMTQRRSPSYSGSTSVNTATDSMFATPMDWENLIRAEYFEMPGLSLTLHQVARLWNLAPPLAEALLRDLQQVHFLRRTEKGTYVRADLGLV